MKPLAEYISEVLKKNMQPKMHNSDEFINETNHLSPWSEGVLSMGDDITFLKLVWKYDIKSLNSLVDKTKEELELCKNAQKSGGILKSIWKKDKFNLEFRLKCLNQIIKSKKENPDYIPTNYK